MALGFPLGDIADMLSAELHGDRKFVISNIAPLNQANETSITYLRDQKGAKFLRETKAAAVLLTQDFVKDCPVHSIVVENPELAFARVARLFSYESIPMAGIHPSAVVGEHCRIDSSVAIGANCVVGDGVEMGANSIIHPGTTIGDNVKIGQDCTLYSNVTIYYHVIIGDAAIIHSAAVIGADGFGMAQDGERWEKIPQLGRVRIGNHVEIGANTCIDRGTLSDTIIGNGVKLDNLIQVAHNVTIGDNTVIAGSTAIAGSTKIGKNCIIGGAVRFRDHIEIADHVVITATSVIAKSIKQPGVYSSGFMALENNQWLKLVKRFYKLDELHQKIRRLEEKLNDAK